MQAPDPYLRIPENALTRALTRAMSELSEACWAAGWLSGTEDAVWDLAHGRRSDWGQGSGLEGDVADIMALAELTCAWIIFDRDVGETVPVSLASWAEAKGDPVPGEPTHMLTLGPPSVEGPDDTMVPIPGAWGATVFRYPSDLPVPGQISYEWEIHCDGTAVLEGHAVKHPGVWLRHIIDAHNALIGAFHDDDKARVTATEFREFGFLQEVNRQFLHPLGLALEVWADHDGTLHLGHLRDSRDDPEGYAYADGILDPAKAQRVEELQAQKAAARQATLGYVIQPIPDT